MLQQSFVASDWLTPQLVKLVFRSYKAEAVINLKQYGHFDWSISDPNCAYLWMYDHVNQQDFADYLQFLNEEETSADISV